MEFWKEKYLLMTSIEGRVTYFKFWNNNQYAEMGETILTVVPEVNEIFGHLLMPIGNSGKVQLNQIVNIHLENYPYNEFGTIKGRIAGISKVPQNNLYAVTVSLQEGLKTTHDIKLDFKEQMKGSAEIILEDHRLIERFFYQLNKIIDN